MGDSVKAAMRTVAVVTGAALAVMSAGLASGADIPVKAKPKAIAVQGPAWEGFYVGGHVGYGFGVARQSGPGVIETDFTGSSGFAGGAIAGYNHMLSARTLVGIEGDVSWSDIEHKLEVASPDALTLKLKQKLSYSARVRLGFLATPQTLLYGTAGWARSNFEYSLSFPFDPFNELDKHWIDGVQAGAGVETNLGGGWGARLEYIHTFYQTRTFFGEFDVRPAVGIGRIALLRRFGADKSATPWDAPEPATRWTGVYVGGAIGAGAGSTKADLLTRRARR